MDKPLYVKCPVCSRKGEWFETRFGPFCSERCKLVDLGKWFSEENQISEPLRPDHFLEFESLEGGPELDRPDNQDSE